MSATFELLTDDTGQFRVVLLSENREILAASVLYADKARAAAGIAKVREIAGTGLIVGANLSLDQRRKWKV
ncbi:YegP family protein [Arthrobacter sp. R1-13]